MASTLSVAALQYCAAGDAQTTLAHITPMIAYAAAKGARLVALPEAATFIAPDRNALETQAEWEDQSTELAAFCTLAERHKLYLLVGSLFVRRRADNALVNRCYLIGPDGTPQASYDKIHMFDATVGDGQTYRESDYFTAGTQAVMHPIDGIQCGLTICYDVRFPHLYRHLAQAGAQILTTPAAFTYNSGRAHWHILQRARAIETGCYVIAPAQCGTHADGRRTYGHAMIISPWGEILAEANTDDAAPKAGANDAVIFAQIDPTLPERVRRAIPSLANGRPFDECQTDA